MSLEIFDKFVMIMTIKWVGKDNYSIRLIPTLTTANIGIKYLVNKTIDILGRENGKMAALLRDKNKMSKRFFPHIKTNLGDLLIEKLLSLEGS